MIFDPYSSKFSVSDPLSSVPLVDVTFSSPLKNAPLTAAPSPAISNRNGISTLLTTTVASQRPARVVCAAAADGDAALPAPASRAAAITQDSFVRITTPIHGPPS